MTVPTDGWYPDPQVPGVERWWGQGAWTDQIRPALPTVPPPAPPPIGPSSASRVPRRRRWPLVALSVVVAVVVAVVLIAALGGGSSSFTVHGSMSLVGVDNFTSFGDNNCAGSTGYDDLRDGAEVVISENGGKTVAVGTLEGSRNAADQCRFSFDISGVPKGKKFYGVSVTHRGVVQFTEQEMKAGPALTIGSGS